MSSWPYSWDWYSTWSSAAVHAPPLRPALLGSWNWEFILDTSAEVWESWEPEIMRTEAGMACWALLANFSRFLEEGCLVGEERVPFLCDFDLVLESFFEFDDFLDCCFFRLERLPSCGLALLRLRLLSPLVLDLLRLPVERPLWERPSLGVSLGLDLLLERLLWASLVLDLLRELRLVRFDSRVRDDLTVDFDTLVSAIDLVPTDRPLPPFSRLLFSLPIPLLLLLCLFGRGGGGGGGLSRILLL
mmetsp:Transcript_11116/g.24096  ORF Transcript_11116/g.24096 Transcript_11116/m.24096 type:complete len:245 (+) Transcript_11116:237-971(+)